MSAKCYVLFWVQFTCAFECLNRVCRSDLGIVLGMKSLFRLIPLFELVMSQVPQHFVIPPPFISPVKSLFVVVFTLNMNLYLFADFVLNATNVLVHIL